MLQNSFHINLMYRKQSHKKWVQWLWKQIVQHWVLRCFRKAVA